MDEKSLPLTIEIASTLKPYIKHLTENNGAVLQTAIGKLFDEFPGLSEHSYTIHAALILCAVGQTPNQELQLKMVSEAIHTILNIELQRVLNEYDSNTKQ